MQIIILSILIIIILLWHSSQISGLGLLFFTLRDISCFMERGWWPLAQLPTRRTRSPYLWPQETGWPSCTPSHCVARNFGLATSHTQSNCEPLRWGAHYLYVSPRWLAALCRVLEEMEDICLLELCLNMCVFIIARYLFVIYSSS